MTAPGASEGTLTATRNAPRHTLSLTRHAHLPVASALRLQSSVHPVPLFQPSLQPPPPPSVAGIPVRPPVARRPLKQMAEYTINAQKSGHIKNLDFLEQYRRVGPHAGCGGGGNCKV